MTIVLTVLMAGFPFQIPNMNTFLQGVAKINPVRWTFEALLNWKFNKLVIYDIVS